MIPDILKIILCSSLLLATYHLLLEKEKMLKFNRYFLLLSLAFSLLTPLIGIEVAMNIKPVVSELPFIYNTDWVQIAETTPAAITTMQQSTPEKTTIPLSSILLYLYITISTLLLISFIYHILVIYFRIKACTVVDYGSNIKLTLINEQTIPHSFFNYIFVNKTEFENRNIEKEILTHESTHAKQNHSADVLFVELLIIFFWFNPALYLYRRAIKLNHEFLADQSVVDVIDDVPVYQLMLISKASESNSLALTSNLNYLITKKRLIMMTKKTSASLAVWKKTAAIISFALVATIFCIKITATTPLPSPLVIPETEVENNTPTEANQEKDNKADVPKMMYRPLVGTYIGSTLNGVSQEMVNEYSNIVKKYKETYKTQKRIEENVSATDKERLESIFMQMSRRQQQQQDIIFVYPDGVLAKIQLTEDEYARYKGAAKCRIWVNNKLIKKSQLNKYSYTDFVTCDVRYTRDYDIVYFYTDKYYSANYKEPSDNYKNGKLIYTIMNE